MPHFEDLKVGDEVLRLVKGDITRQSLVEWCAAENDYFPAHYDDDVARRIGLPEPVIQGTYKYALLGQMLTRWLGGTGVLRRVKAEYRGWNVPGETIVCRGRVAALRRQDTTGLVELEVWVENAKGERSAFGVASVELPTRPSSA